MLQDEYRDAPGSVITADIYHSNLLMPLSDEAIVARMADHIATCEPAFRCDQAGSLTMAEQWPCLLPPPTWFGAGQCACGACPAVWQGRACLNCLCGRVERAPCLNCRIAAAGMPRW
jgi:hypothetical protein